MGYKSVKFEHYVEDGRKCFLPKQPNVIPYGMMEHRFCSSPKENRPDACKYDNLCCVHCTDRIRCIQEKTNSPRPCTFHDFNHKKDLCDNGLEKKFS